MAERLSVWPGVAVWDSDGLGLLDGVGLALGVRVSDGVLELVASLVAEADRDAVPVGCSVAVPDCVGPAVPVHDSVSVDVPSGVGVQLAEVVLGAVLDAVRLGLWDAAGERVPDVVRIRHPC